MNIDKTQHTKGTWVYADTFSAIVAIKDNKVMCIADFGKGEIGAEESKANAEYIIKCVNAERKHDELVKALLEVQSMLIHNGDAKGDKAKTEIIKYCPEIRNIFNNLRTITDENNY